MSALTYIMNPITGMYESIELPEDIDLHQDITRCAFADMLHDTERNQKYYVALKRAINKMHSEGKKANVLDIGTGTGLLSIMAARCGADSIVACEAFKPVAECALEIIVQNKMAEKIKLIPKRSTNITVGENGDMPERANILVTEVFDTELIGEGAIGTFTHAHQNLLTKDCIVVPNSAVIYAQVVECPSMQKWNKLNDLADDDLNILLKTPERIKRCAGSAAVHDIQLSQLPHGEFRPLSEPLPVITFDWSGRSPVEKRRDADAKFAALGCGVAQMVFMWWELDMDGQGTSINCAPWWCHPRADASTPNPQDTIPWRDHWMQAVYYFPKPILTKKNQEYTLSASHDEYCLWFNIDTADPCKQKPVCDCGIHMKFSRTQVAYMNDTTITKKFLNAIRKTTDDKSVIYNMNEGSLIGLGAAVMGVKKVYYSTANKILVDVLNQYIKENDIRNVEIVGRIGDEELKEVTHIIIDPNHRLSILPWHNLKMFYRLFKRRNDLSENVKILPEGFSLWAVPVRFKDLHKIRIALGVCEGVDMTIFDDMVEMSRELSEEEIEPQPLWEYPCVCQGTPREILRMDLTYFRDVYSNKAEVKICKSDPDFEADINGVALWCVWHVGGKPVNLGAREDVSPGERMEWHRQSRQAVYIPAKSQKLTGRDTWAFNVKCIVKEGRFECFINVGPVERYAAYSWKFK